MKKCVFFLFITLSLFFMQGCGQKSSPKADFAEYIKYWENKDYKGMYSILDEHSKKTIEESAFVERYTKIYSGIDVIKIDIKPDYSKKLAEESDYVKVPFECLLQTNLGDLKFNSNAKFIDEKISDKKIAWRIHWDTTMIFPDLGQGDKVRVVTSSAVRGAIYDRNQKPLAISDQEGNRIYPNEISSGHLVGYIRQITKEDLDKLQGKGYSASDSIGKSGAEYWFEDRLRPKNGVEIYIEDSKQNKKKILLKKEAQNGENIKLTVDSNIQIALYNQIKDEAGVGVVMNPKTGELLGLVSAPSYNSQDFINGMSNETWNKLNNDPRGTFVNRFAAALVPGSTFKPITAAIGLECNKINPSQNKGISGLKWQKSGWGNHFVTRVSSYAGLSNLRNALVYSDNIYFAQSALDIGTDLFVEGTKKFGIGEKIPIEYNLTSSKVFNKSIGSEGQLADTGYGQGELLLNPVQLLAMYSFMSNDGNIIKPRILLDEANKPEFWKNNVCSKENTDLIKTYLGEVVSDPGGSGNSAYMPELPLAGKTGTAETKATLNESNSKELGWFVAFDKNNSKLSALIMVENVQGRGGSHFCVPKVKSIFQEFCK